MGSANIALAGVPPQVNDPLATYSHAANLGGLLQQRQLQQVALQEKQMELQDNQNLRSLYIQHKGDLSRVLADAPNAGVSPKTINALTEQFQKIQQTAASTDQMKLQNSLSHNDRLSGRIDVVKSIKDPMAQAAAWSQQRKAAVAAGDLDPNDPNIPEEFPGMDHLEGIYAGLLGHKQITEEALRAQQLANAATENKIRTADEARKVKAEALQALTGVQNQQDFDAWSTQYPEVAKTLHSGGEPGAPSPFDPATVQKFVRQAVPVKEQPEYDIATKTAASMAKMTPADWQRQVQTAAGGNAKLAERTQVLVDAAVARGDFKAAQAAIKDASDQIGRTETAVATAKATLPVKIELGAGMQAAKDKARLPSDDAIDLMAEDILNGKNPSSKNALLYAKAMDRAAAVAKERGLTAKQVLLERNAAGANKKALDAVTKQYETLKPFAEMAEKNADVLEAKSKLVSDLGASVLNTPIRELQSKFTGNKNVAAYRAALLPVQADFARVLNSPTGSGVLSDTARSEMGKAIKDGATVGELKAALDVFRTDAKNRRESYEADIADLKQRSVAGGGTVEPPPEKKTTSTTQIPAPVHRIKFNNKFYDYKGSGATDDLNNYTEVK